MSVIRTNIIRVRATEEEMKMATIDVDMVKCACADCVCIVSVGKAVTRDGRSYCCDDCANGHTDHRGYEHAGCPCHG